MLAAASEETDVQRPLPAAAAHRLLPWFALALAAVVALPAFASDANVERQAQALQKKAIEEDSLNLAYPEAIKKLATAISKCGEDKCNATLKGALYRDLGAVLILSGSVDEGRAAFLKALSFDPSLELDPAYKSPMLEQLWRDAKKKAGVAAAGAGEPAGAAPPGGAAAGSSEVPGATGQPAAGDFAHVAAGAQLVRTPLPVYAEYLGTEKLLRVVVKYRGAGMTDWKPLELRKMESGYGGLIPCKDVTEGVMQYYIQGYGTSDDPVAASGSRTKPYSVPIKPELTGPAPTLPGQEPPKQCAESAGGGGDCPPDFPGCHAQKRAGGEDCSRNGQCESGSCSGGKCVEKSGEGEECEKDSECASGTCSDGKCTAPKKLSGDACDTDDDCASGTCKDGKCGEGSGKKSQKGPRLWIGVSASVDLVNLPGAQDVCVLNNNNPPSPKNGAGYECVDPGTGKNFPGTNPAVNASIVQGRGDSVGGGFTLGNIRLMASLDYATSMNVLLGARIGYVLSTDPASSPGPAFAPIHLEARLTYLFGKDALASSVAPLVLLALGAGEFDASFGVQVATTTNMRPLNETAWLVAGPFFAAAGGGLRFLLGPNLAATVAVKAQGAFGGTAGSLLGFSPEAGIQLGF